MVILRPTRKLRSLLPIGDVAADISTTALGDWYVNRVIVNRRPLLLLLSSTSLLPILTPARDVRQLPDRLSDLVVARLTRCGVSRPAVEAEARAMSPVQVHATVDRSVLGIMVDFAKGIPHYLGRRHWDDSSLQFVEDLMAETPCYAGGPEERCIVPRDKAPALLRAAYEADSPA